LNKDKELHTRGFFKLFLKNKSVHRYIIAIFTIILLSIVIVDGASPKQYSLSLGEISGYDIISPGNIIDEVNTLKNRQEAEASVAYVMIKDVKASSEALKKWVDFVLAVEKSRKNTRQSIRDAEVFETDEYFLEESKKDIIQKEALSLDAKLKELGISIANGLLLYIVSEENCKEKDMESFKEILGENIDELIG